MVVAGNVLMLGTISARYCSGVRYLSVCLSVCLSARRRRYVVLRITLLFIYLKQISEYFWKKIFYKRDVFPGIQTTARLLYFMLYIKVPCTSAVLDPRIGRFVGNLPPLSSVFNGSQQTITSQPGPLRCYTANVFLVFLFCSTLPTWRIKPDDNYYYYYSIIIISFFMQFPSFRST